MNPLSASACSSQYVMPISWYIAVAVARCSRVRAARWAPGGAHGSVDSIHLDRRQVIFAHLGGVPEAKKDDCVGSCQFGRRLKRDRGNTVWRQLDVALVQHDGIGFAK